MENFAQRRYNVHEHNRRNLVELCRAGKRRRWDAAGCGDRGQREWQCRGRFVPGDGRRFGLGAYGNCSGRYRHSDGRPNADSVGQRRAIRPHADLSMAKIDRRRSDLSGYRGCHGRNIYVAGGRRGQPNRGGCYRHQRKQRDGFVYQCGHCGGAGPAAIGQHPDNFRDRAGGSDPHGDRDTRAKRQ